MTEVSMTLAEALQFALEEVLERFPESDLWDDYENDWLIRHFSTTENEDGIKEEGIGDWELHYNAMLEAIRKALGILAELPLGDTPFPWTAAKAWYGSNDREWGTDWVIAAPAPPIPVPCPGNQIDVAHKLREGDALLITALTELLQIKQTKGETP